MIPLIIGVVQPRYADPSCSDKAVTLSGWMIPNYVKEENHSVTYICMCCVCVCCDPYSK